MPTTIKATSFSAAGATSAVTANNTLYDGWKDQTGNVYSITGSAPNSVLTSGAASGNLYNSTANSLLDVQVILYINQIPASGTTCKISMRAIDNGSGLPTTSAYNFIIQPTSYVIQFFDTGTGTFENPGFYGWGSVPTATPLVIVMDLIRTGTNITTAKYRICTQTTWASAGSPETNADAVTYIVTQTLVDNRTSGASAGRLQTAGWCLIGSAAGVTRVVVNDATTALTRPEILSTYGSPTKITMAVPSGQPTGGTAPYTYRWHIRTTPPDKLSPIGKDSSTEIAGQTGNGANSLTYNFVDSDPRYLLLKVTDSVSNVVYSNLLSARPWKQPLNIVFIGDSYTAGAGTTIWDPCDQCAEDLRNINGPRFVAYANNGVSQTKAQNWLPPADSEYNAEGLTSNPQGFIGTALTSITTLKSSYPEALTICSIMLGINDALGDSTFDDNTVPSPSTFAARINRICAALLLGGADKCIIHYPPYCATQQSGIDNLNGGTGSYRARGLFNFQAALAAIANGTTVLIGDTVSYFNTSNSPQLIGNSTYEVNLAAEGHPRMNDTNNGTSGRPDGSRAIGHGWAYGIVKALGISGISSGGSGPTPSVGSSPFIRGI